MTHAAAVKVIVRRIAFLEARRAENSGGRRDLEEQRALLFLLDAMRELLAKLADPGREVRELRERVAILEAEAKTFANRLNKAKAKLRTARGTVVVAAQGLSL